jgi:hypothetical protein
MRVPHESKWLANETVITAAEDNFVFSLLRSTPAALHCNQPGNRGA